MAAKKPKSGPWYAGHQTRLGAFDPARVGQGNDQLGPGFYMTDDPANARHYGPFVHELRVTWKKVLPTAQLYAPIPAVMLRAFLDAIPKEEEYWQDFDERPARGYAMALRAFEGHTFLRAVSNLQGTFTWYRDEPARILRVLVGLGYTGFTVPAGSTQNEPSKLATTWAVVWDENALRIVDVREDTARAENPLAAGALKGHQTPWINVPAMVALAEEKLGVVASGAVHGCGNWGCAVPTSDGEVLKITTDADEVRAFTLAKELGLEGFARVTRGPVFLQSIPSDDPSENDVSVHAFTRESLPSASLVGDPQIAQALEDLQMPRHARVPARRAALLRALEAFPRSRAIAAAFRALQKHHLNLRDVRPENLGERPDGTLVIRDAQAQRQTASAPALVLWHGAKRWDGPPELKPGAKKGVVEAGPGLYLTTSADTAKKYARGGGKVIRFELSPDLRWVTDLHVPVDTLKAWVTERPKLRHKADLVADLDRYAARTKRHAIPPQALVNLLIHYEALTGEHAPALALFLVSLGADGDLMRPPLFARGPTEDWVVLYNLDKIRSWRRAEPNEVVDLPPVAEQLRALGGPTRAKNPPPPADATPWQAAIRRDFPSLKVTLDSAGKLGGGGFGYVLSAGDRVVKITRDPLERDLVEAAIEDGKFDGFVRVDQAPVQRADGAPVWAYVREPITPFTVDEAVEALLRRDVYDEEGTLRPPVLRRLRMAGMPEIAAFLERLASRGRGWFVDDMAHNIGRRSDGTLVLFDGRLDRLEGTQRQENPKKAIDLGLTREELADIRARVAAGAATDEDTERLIVWAPRARAAAGEVGRFASDWKDRWRRFVPATRTDAEARADLLEWIDTRSHDALAAKAKTRASAARAERAERAYEAQGVNLEDLWHDGDAAVRRKAAGKDVWLYHGTSSLLLPDILKHGLLPGENVIDAKTPGVFLTTQPGHGYNDGGTAAFYAARAAQHFGGDPVVLRVLVPFDDLQPDPDDEDIQSGRYQYVIDAVPTAWIYEVNGEKTPAALSSTKARKKARK